jgi:hypothetical protein
MPLWIWAGNSPFVLPSEYNTEWMWSVSGMIIDMENQRTWIKLCPIAILSNTNPTRTDLGMCRYSEKPATNHQGYDTAIYYRQSIIKTCFK